MILAGLPPAKAIVLATKSLKLWLFQMHEEQQMKSAKINYLEKKYNEVQFACNKAMDNERQKYESEINSRYNLHFSFPRPSLTLSLQSHA